MGATGFDRYGSFGCKAYSGCEPLKKHKKINADENYSLAMAA